MMNVFKSNSVSLPVCLLQLKSLGELCGLVSKKGPTSEDLHRTVDLLAGLGDERPETSEFSDPTFPSKGNTWILWSLALTHKSRECLNYVCGHWVLPYLALMSSDDSGLTGLTGLTVRLVCEFFFLPLPFLFSSTSRRTCWKRQQNVFFCAFYWTSLRLSVVYFNLSSNFKDF